MKEQKNENGLVRRKEVEAIQLSNGIDESDRVKKFTTIDLNDKKDSNMLVNAMQKPDKYLKDCIGEVIECVGCYVIARDNDSFNEDTGETVTRTKHVLVLFDVNGKSYLTGSGMCYRAFSDITAINGLPSKENHIKLKPINIEADTKGHNFLSLTVVD